MNEGNELILERAAHLQLLDLEDRRAELIADDPIALTELEITYDLIEADIQTTLQSIRDRRIARAVHNAGRTADSALIARIAQAESSAQEERRRLLGLSRRSSRRPSTSSSGSSDISNPSNPLSLSNFEPSEPGSPDSSTTNLPGPSNRGPVNKSVPLILRLPNGRDTVECIICTEFTTEAYEAPCGCFYHQGCIIQSFTKAMDDESLFPPRCCTQNIPLDQIRTILSPEFIARYEKKEKEFSTPNRLGEKQNQYRMRQMLILNVLVLQRHISRGLCSVQERYGSTTGP
ncbi:hypothetical protein RHS04_00025 [Rhizoctonia solani]|uniref:RING-type domain-containing protein n=1 Tax=Rhizoctonia solani TaxID=456999 RepID=A0A8H7HFP7_9AGAM|nr:hypothetical protein RHS04_00025 [Rhizoctonia solani]